MAITTLAIVQTAAAALLAIGANMSNVPSGYTPVASDGLYTLATTGSGDAYAAEGFGKSYHKDGGSPFAGFTYSKSNASFQAKAETALKEGEFLAPHYVRGNNGYFYIMIAPHLIVDGEVSHGAGPDDNIIVVTDKGEVLRFDYSDDIAS